MSENNTTLTSPAFEKSILIRVGEIFLKGNNKYFFESVLLKNIKNVLKGINCVFLKTQNRYYVEQYSIDNEALIIDKLLKVIGIHSISVAFRVETNIENIATMAIDMMPANVSFRVTCNRADKRVTLSSTEMAREIGGRMLQANKGLKVDLFKFEKEMFVDMRENGQTYVFMDKIIGQQGMPVGCSGNAMLLLSGGIDSPVAGYMMAKRGVTLKAVHFHSYPYTSELALQKVCDLAQVLSTYAGNIDLFIVPFTEIQYAIHENCPEEYMITIMRRIMMRIAEKLSLSNKCGAIITGESLGQVASQTMESINATNSVVTIPVFRPLIGNDKNDIIDVSKKIDTYDISIRPYEDCCTVFLPKNPIIHPKLTKVEECESVLDIETLIDKALSGTEVKRIHPNI